MALQVMSTGSCSVAVLRMSNPPLNAVSAGLRRRMIRDLAAAAQAPEVDAVVLLGEPGVFASSLPIREIEAGVEAPSLAELCRTIEDMPKPVIACLEGHVAGAGMDIALAAHGRVATARARLGFPDLHIGLTPSGGATQRLPRLVGADAALSFLIGAVPQVASAPVARRLIDRMVQDGPVLQAGLELAAEFHDTGLWRRTRDRDTWFAYAQAYQDAIESWRHKPGSTTPEVQSLIGSVEAARLLSFDAGVAREEAEFQELRQSSRTRGLCRARFGEQRCTRLTGRVYDGPLSFAVSGAIPRCTRIAGAAALAGVPAVIADPDAMLAAQAVGAVKLRLARHAAARGLPVAVGETLAAQVSAAPEMAAIGAATLVFVSGRGPAAAIAQRLEDIAPHVADDAVVLCLTEDEDCEMLAPPSLAGRVMGLVLADRDFPARLAEVQVSDATTARSLAIAQAGLRRIGRVLVRSPAGFPAMSSVLFDTMLAAADRLVAQGVHPAAIDRALVIQGHQRGCYQMLAQVDAAAYLRRLDLQGAGGRLSARLLRDGIAPPRDGVSNAMLDGLAAGLRTGAAWTPPPALISSAISLALVNAGCRLIETGGVERPMQIDVTMIQGWGYPRDTGGPMSEADLMGLYRVVQLGTKLRSWSQELWAPHPVLEDLARSGRRFLDLDTGDRARNAA